MFGQLQPSPPFSEDVTTGISFEGFKDTDTLDQDMSQIQTMLNFANVVATEGVHPGLIAFIKRTGLMASTSIVSLEHVSEVSHARDPSVAAGVEGILDDLKQRLSSWTVSAWDYITDSTKKLGEVAAATTSRISTMLGQAKSFTWNQSQAETVEVEGTPYRTVAMMATGVGVVAAVLLAVWKRDVFVTLLKDSKASTKMQQAFSRIRLPGAVVDFTSAASFRLRRVSNDFISGVKKTPKALGFTKENASSLLDILKRNVTSLQNLIVQVYNVSRDYVRNLGASILKSGQNVSKSGMMKTLERGYAFMRSTVRMIRDTLQYTLSEALAPLNRVMKTSYSASR